MTNVRWKFATTCAAAGSLCYSFGMSVAWQPSAAGGPTCVLPPLTCRTECTSRPKALPPRRSGWKSSPTIWRTSTRPASSRTCRRSRPALPRPFSKGRRQPGDHSINDIGGGVKIIDVETDLLGRPVQGNRQRPRLRDQRQGFLSRPRRRRRAVSDAGRQLRARRPRPAGHAKRSSAGARSSGQRDHARPTVARGRCRRTDSSRRTARLRAGPVAAAVARRPGEGRQQPVPAAGQRAAAAAGRTQHPPRLSWKCPAPTRCGR